MPTKFNPEEAVQEESHKKGNDSDHDSEAVAANDCDLELALLISVESQKFRAAAVGKVPLCLKRVHPQRRINPSPKRQSLKHRNPKLRLMI